ncbi:MAG TPA: hypothetical protein VFV94_07340 [Polyangiaceae bacterium]|nr:hypothetical protein [Polyangiaceae bacterium]
MATVRGLSDDSARSEADRAVQKETGARPFTTVIHATRPILAFLFATALFARPKPAAAQIKEPGNHPHYSVELEPHFTFGWHGGPHHFDDDGFGAGLRASIPIIDNGPVTSINNSFAITFGVDWLHFGYDHDAACRDFPGPGCDDHDYAANAFWFPVAAQWNFYVHRRISVFAELGVAIVHERYSWARPCPGAPGTICDYDDTHTDFAELVFYPGARFMLTDGIGLTVRVGFPHVTLGASFLL